MKQRDLTSAKAKEVLIPDKVEVAESLAIRNPDVNDKYAQRQNNIADELFDSCAKMATHIVKKESEIAIRLYLLRTVIENITLRNAIIKYKVQIAATREVPYHTLNDNQFYNTYEGYVKLVPREPIDNAEEIDWKDIENDFVTFLTKELEV